MEVSPPSNSEGLGQRARSAVGRVLARAARSLGAEPRQGIPPDAWKDEKSRLDEVERMAQIGSWTADLVLNRTMWSDEFFRICGYEPQSFEPDYERYLATIHPDDVETVRASVEQALKDLQPYNHEYRLIRPDGSQRFCLAHGNVYADDTGAIVRLTGTCQDITESKSVEKELTLHREQLEEAQRIAMLGSWHWDLVGGKVAWSDELSRIFGHDPTTFDHATHAGVAIHPDDRDRVQAIVDQLLKDRQPVSYEFRIVRPDGEIRHCQARMDLFIDDSGAPLRVVGTAQDITERRVMEEELFRIASARAEAEGANLAKGKFLTSMSHELRTPLNSVIGFANVLLKNKTGNLGAKDLQYLERIRDNGAHLLDLINDVLDLSKVEAGKMEVESETFSLVGLITETLSELRGAAGENVELRAILPDSAASITSDPRKLKQILINLVGNAIKFTEKGEVVVELFVDPASGLSERIEVRDTGVGIPSDRLSAIFAAFEQAESGTGRRFGGSGMGLAIVASLSEILGFGIEVDSEPGVGSTFRLTLHPSSEEPPSNDLPQEELRLDSSAGNESRPESAAKASASDESVRDADRARSPLSRGTAARLPTGEMNLDNRLVLVIDDDTDSRILLTHNLEESGARTITASTGEQGVRMAREFRPDIITLDILLPGISGWETLAAIKSDSELCAIPVVIVSAVGREHPAPVVGAAEVIEKPINREKLVSTLRRALDEAPRRILIVDDTPDARDLLISYFEDEDVEIRTASDGVEALRIIEEFTPDIVLLDLIMPNLDGLAVIRRLNEREPYLNIPIIIVTAKELTGAEAQNLKQSSLAVVRKGARLEQDLRDSLKGIL